MPSARGRQLASDDKPQLHELHWESLPSVDWGDEAKMRYTIDAWGDLVQALLDAPPAAALRRAAGRRRAVGSPSVAGRSLSASQ